MSAEVGCVERRKYKQITVKPQHNSGLHPYNITGVENEGKNVY